MRSHKRIVEAMELLENLEWLKNLPLNISFKQEPNGNCVVYSEDTGHKEVGLTPYILCYVKNKIKKITPEIIDLWG